MESPPPRTPNDSFVTTALDGKGISIHHMRRLLAVGLLAAVLVGGFFTLHGHNNATTTQRGVQPTATKALGFAQFDVVQPYSVGMIAFGPGAVYGCGSVTNGEISLASSTDEGRNWSSSPIQGAQGECGQIAVNPTNNRQIVVTIFRCDAPCQDFAVQNAHLYRSADGGTHWAEVAFPTTPLSHSGYDLAWNGANLLMGCTYNCAPHQLLAISAPNAPARWVNFGAAGAGFTTCGRIVATKQSLFATLYNQQGRDAISATLRSDDLGQHWHTVKYVDSASGAAIVLLAASPRSAILFGETAGGIERSLDGGVTWRSVPLPPGSWFSLTNMTPDGTVGAVLKGASADELLLWPPGAKIWSHRGYFPPQTDQYIGLGWDVAGKPNALWALTPNGLAVSRL